MALRLRIERAGSERRCPRCGETKRIEDFGNRYSAYCRACHALRARERRPLRTPEQRARDRFTETARRNGITVAALGALLESQNDLCAICGIRLGGRSGKWHIDHDHSCCDTGNGRKSELKRTPACGQCIRGILCGQCNVGLGMFRDDPMVLESAVRYLKH